MRNLFPFFALALFTFSLLSSTASATYQNQRADEIFSLMKQKFEDLKDYKCIYESYNSDGSEKQNATYRYFFKKPKLIRMEVLSEKYQGTVMIYNVIKRKDKVKLRLRKSGIKGFFQRLFKTYLDLDDKRILDLRGNGIHESDWGWFIEQHLNILNLGKGEFIREEEINGQSTYVYTLILDFPEKTMSIKKEEIWINTETYFPLKFIQYNNSGEIVRQSIFKDVEFDVDLEDELFWKFK